MPVLIPKLPKSVAVVIGGLLSLHTVFGRAVLSLSAQNFAVIFSSFFSGARFLSIVNSMHPSANVWSGRLEAPASGTWEPLGTDSFSMRIRGFSGTAGVSIIEVGLTGFGLEELDDFALPVLTPKLPKSVVAVIGGLLSGTAFGRAVLILNEKKPGVGAAPSFFCGARSLSMVKSMHPASVLSAIVSIILSRGRSCA